MQATVVFEGAEGVGASYGLVFIPCPVWIQGDRKLINLNPETPAYQPGSVKRLLEQDKPRLESRKCVVVVHSHGNGTEADISNLIEDVTKEDFEVRTVPVP